jgi:hypothetical protein
LDIRWCIGAYAVPSFPKDTMSIRFIGALLCGAAFVLVTATGALAKENQTKGVSTATQKKQTPNAGTTGINRMGGGGGGKGAVQLNPQPEPPGRTK